MAENYVGVFRGRKTIQKNAVVGGARSVFVKLQDNGNDLKYPSFGAYIKNPFKGAAKAFAGDLFEYRTDANGLNPELYLLKTYVISSANGNQIHILRDGYKHIPFVGDRIGMAPETIGGKMTSDTITSVTIGKVDGNNVWTCTLGSGLSGVKIGDVLVEADNQSTMLVKNINAVAPTDLDMFDAPAADDDDFEGARYSYTPALGGIMYESKMSPLPDCVKKLNVSNVNGWFQVKGVY